MSDSQFNRLITMGVGEAVNRLIKINMLLGSGIAQIPEDILEERRLIVSALNQFELNLQFDCNNDGVPDTVEIFQTTASTSCCRIMPFMSGRSSIAPAPGKKGRGKPTTSVEPVFVPVPEPAPIVVPVKEAPAPPIPEPRGTVKPRKKGLAGLFGKKED